MSQEVITISHLDYDYNWTVEYIDGAKNYMMENGVKQSFVNIIAKKDRILYAVWLPVKNTYLKFGIVKFKDRFAFFIGNSIITPNDPFYQFASKFNIKLFIRNTLLFSNEELKNTGDRQYCCSIIASDKDHFKKEFILACSGGQFINIGFENLTSEGVLNLV